MSASDIVDALVALAWPILVGAVIWRLMPMIRKIMDQRGFTIKAGSAEITVQQASDQLLDRVEDLREQVSALKAQVAAIHGTDQAMASPITTGVPQLRRILWVDDFPQNNAYEVAALERKGVKVDLVSSTGDALSAAGAAQPPFDAIISDMGRKEDGTEHPQAGLELIAQLKGRGIDAPVFVYASAPAITRNAEQLKAAGVTGTASANELLELLGRLGQQ